MSTTAAPTPSPTDPDPSAAAAAAKETLPTSGRELLWGLCPKTTRRLLVTSSQRSSRSAWI